MKPEHIERLRSEIVDYSRRLHANGWVANHDGNLTARLEGNTLLGGPWGTFLASFWLYYKKIHA